ncbi:MAG: TetR/AcrR family transcriptional regulator, partial [Silicimonas sp.]|nr:TetR/AcrR family transcriptional regulator [Silicimonas sp.]
KIDDIDLAADQLPELCKAGLHLKMVLGLRAAPEDAEIDRVVASAVDMFLCKYGPDS